MITLSSRDNINIKNAVKLKNSAKFRRKTGLFIAEGLRVCYDALLSGADIDSVFVSGDALSRHPGKIEELCEAADRSFVVTDDIFSQISDTQTPQGVLYIPEFLRNNPRLTSYAAVVGGSAEKLTDIRFDDCSVAVIGNEGNGLTEKTICACDHKITIPMRGRAESLNASAAASIIIWEMIK